MVDRVKSLLSLIVLFLKRFFKWLFRNILKLIKTLFIKARITYWKYCSYVFSSFPSSYKIFKFFIWLVYDFTCIRFIKEKLKPPNIDSETAKNPPSTLLIWILGIYFAAWGLAMTKYEFKSNNIQYQTSNATAILLEGEKEDIDYSIVVELQSETLPKEPKLLQFNDTIDSLFELSKYEVDSNVKLLKNYIELNKKYLSGADLSGANLSGANLIGADLDKADLSKANLSEANLSGAYLNRANLDETNLREVYLGRADLSSADLSKANLSGANLREANLSGAYLNRAYLSEADLIGASLYKADLGQAYLNYANLSGTDLRVADLKLADLSGADLSGANLIGANLIGADLIGADLIGASLYKADLSWSDLSDEQIKEVKSFYEIVFKNEKYDNTKLFNKIKEIAPEKLEISSLLKGE